MSQFYDLAADFVKESAAFTLRHCSLELVSSYTEDPDKRYFGIWSESLAYNLIDSLNTCEFQLWEYSSDEAEIQPNPDIVHPQILEQRVEYDEELDRETFGCDHFVFCGLERSKEIVTSMWSTHERDKLAKLYGEWHTLLKQTVKEHAILDNLEIWAASTVMSHGISSPLKILGKVVDAREGFFSKPMGYNTLSKKLII